MLSRIAVLVLCGLPLQAVAAAELSAATTSAFNQYVAKAEARIGNEERSSASFLELASLPAEQRADAQARLRRGEILVTDNGRGPTEIPGGLIHHWTGIVLVPNASIAQVLAVVQDYDHLASYYRPEVLASRMISRTGDDFHIAMRVRRHKVVTVILDSEYDVHYGRLDADHFYSVSRSTHVFELDGDRRLPEGRDHGYLWRLNSYWRFVQTHEGVLVQCEAISLTRDIPPGLGWLIRPIIEQIPRESLEFTLRATRDAAVSGGAVRHTQSQSSEDL